MPYDAYQFKAALERGDLEAVKSVLSQFPDKINACLEVTLDLKLITSLCVFVL